MDGNDIVETAILPTSARPRERMAELYARLYRPGVQSTVATGYGRALLPQADRQVTEITCHARGAAFLCPGISCVVDIGGQDCKAILLDKGGFVADFAMNDKCAAGTGRFIEMMCRILDCDLDEVDEFVRECSPVEITSMCTVFAESEIISLLAEGHERGDIALGVVRSICRRTAYFAQRLSPSAEVFFSGGLARFGVFRAALEEFIGLPVRTSEMSQYAGALGAALIGQKKR